MARLTMENLEARDVMSASVLPGVAPAFLEAQAAALADIGDSATVHFTPPIGSNKGSLIAHEPAANGIIAILIGLQAPSKHDVSIESRQAALADYLEHGPQQNGIIAILIGLRAPTQPRDA